MKPKKTDYAVIISLIILIFILQSLSSGSGTPRLKLISSGDAKYIPLHIDRDYLLEGGSDGVLIRVQDGRAKVVRSDCAAQICVNTGWIKNCGETAVCVPNEAAIYIECKTRGLDAESK